MKILITGGTGFLGTMLIKRLYGRDVEIRLLSRKNVELDKVKCFVWNDSWVDSKALKDVDVLIHLAGANVAEKKWTDSRKKELIDSRVVSLNVLSKKFKALDHWPKRIISASAVGFYGDRGSEVLTENSEKGSDFLSTLCAKWEDTVAPFRQNGSEVYTLRIGVVLNKNFGALQQMILPYKWGLGVKMGNGFFPWIHYEDLVSIVIEAMDGKLPAGVFNASAPNPVTYKNFFAHLRSSFYPYSIPLTIPAKVMKMAFGERSEIFLSSQKVIPSRLLKKGFQFKFPTIEAALGDLLG